MLILKWPTNRNKLQTQATLNTSATLSNKGSNQLTLHSQWLSKKVSTVAVAASAPLTLDLINPSRLSFRTTRTFWILARSRPSSALLKRAKNAKGFVLVEIYTYGCHWNRLRGWFLWWGARDSCWGHCKGKKRLFKNMLVFMWK